MAEPVGLECPGCGELPAFMFGEQQAFCGNDDCPLLMWDPTKTLAQNNADSGVINLNWSDGG